MKDNNFLKKKLELFWKIMRIFWLVFCDFNKSEEKYRQNSCPPPPIDLIPYPWTLPPPPNLAKKIDQVHVLEAH